MEKNIERWELSYTSSDRKFGDAVRNVSVSWENQEPEVVLKNFNAFLEAAGVPYRITREK
jgi:hypothetical protein